MNKNFPQTIYETNDNWGEKMFADADSMCSIIESLHDLGEEWEDCELSDCGEWNLEKSYSAQNIALYYATTSDGRYIYHLFTPLTDGFYEPASRKSIFGRREWASFGPGRHRGVNDDAIAEADTFVAEME